MREIMFKGKRADNGEWVEGAYITMHHNDGRTHIHHFIIPDGSDLSFGTKVEDILVEVDPATVCQCTGLTDKNGKKIFEGDIVKAGWNLAVSWNEIFASWCLSKEGWMYNHFFGTAVDPEDCEVIGNIFDNPKLLNM